MLIARQGGQLSLVEDRPRVRRPRPCQSAPEVRTYVRMTSYAITDPAKPWLILFSSPDLHAIAEALAAQPEVETSGVYATLDGKPRPLTQVEVGELYRLLAARQPESRPHRPAGPE